MDAAKRCDWHLTMLYEAMKDSLRKIPTMAVLLPAALSLFLIGLSGCAGTDRQPRYTKDGQTYGVVSGTFRHRWWNYYERGLSYTEGQYYSEAVSDFQAAIDRRDADQRMARTYGMHFVDYFPHRELGIVYLETGDLENALHHLERSIAHWPTAKARYYLDRVREKMIRRRGGEIDPPDIRLDAAGTEIRTRQDPVILTGTVADDNYVAAVRIGDRQLFLESARKTLQFSETLQLSQGSHVIVLAAENLGGRSSKVELRLIVDREGPLITVEEAAVADGASGKQFRIRGSAYDPAGVETLEIAGHDFNFISSTEVFFEETISTTDGELTLSARDVLGNRTTTVLSGQIAPAVFGARPLLACTDCPMPSLAFLRSTDSRGPVIELKGWRPKQAVFVETIYLEGRVADESNIVQLSLNGAPVLRREGRMIAFGQLARLTEGSNRFIVQAEDEHGNRETHEIEVVRKIPEALKLEQRLSVTVVPFDQKGEISSFGLSFQENLIDALVNRNRFRVIERSLLDSILQEQKFSRTALVEQSTALQLGRLAAAHTIVTGSVVESRRGVEVIARMIDVETSEILDTEDVYSETRDWESLQMLAEGLAVKFHRRFPLVNGTVLETKGNVIFTDLGEEKIGCQKRLLVYRNHPIQHPLSGKILGSDTEILSQARVQQVSAEMTKAELLEPTEATVSAFDRVITQ
jgi:TolB-like protein/tetratricopeptide (TPR) repeat protein